MVQHSDTQQLAAAVRWASFHSTDTLVGPAALGDERAMQLGGEGAPEVTEFCVAEFAAVIGKTTDAGRLYMGDALELAPRLPRIHARVVDDSLEVWRARQIAQNTRFLPPAGAAFLDGELAATASWSPLLALSSCEPRSPCASVCSSRSMTPPARRACRPPCAGIRSETPRQSACQATIPQRAAAPLQDRLNPQA